MKRILSKISILLVVMMIATGAVFATDASVTYEGGADKFVFMPGSEYTETDLFDGFKGVMPGDTIEQKIVVKNDTDDCDFVKIYLKAEAHGDDNALSQAVAEKEDVVSMKDFLAQLDMTVLQDGDVIFEGSGAELEAFEESVLLGEFRKGDESELTVKLSVPIELGSEYANRIGEVDWVFTAEQHDDPEPPVIEPDEPAEEPDEPTEEPKEPGKTPFTGDTSSLMLYAVVLAAAGVALIVLIAKRKRQQ